MENLNFTPGPWEVSHADDTDRQTRGYRNVKAANGETIVCGWTKEANAALIAASPVMFAALQEARVAIATLVCELSDMRESIGTPASKEGDAANAFAFGLVDSAIASARGDIGKKLAGSNPNGQNQNRTMQEAAPESFAALRRLWEAFLYMPVQTLTPEQMAAMESAGQAIAAVAGEA